MMGRRQKLDGHEWDVASRYWRRALCWCSRAGAVKWVKRKMNRRDRRDARLALRKGVE